MTAIAYRDGIMAADTQVGFPPSPGMKLHEPKLARSGGWVFAASGADAPSLSELRQWLFPTLEGQLNKDAGPFRTCGNKREFSVLLASPYEVVTMSHKGVWDTWDISGFYATGSGADVCMGAMELGASAARAVAAAIKYADGCGGDVEAWEVWHERS